MKSKAPLALMEQMVMLLVFALGAALCLQAFVKSDAISLMSQAKSNACLAAQNAAECIRYSGGSMENALKGAADMLGGFYEEGKSSAAEGCLCINYDEQWQVTDKEGVYLLKADGVPVPEDGLQKARVQVFAASDFRKETHQTEMENGEQELLFELDVAWLEEK